MGIAANQFRILYLSAEQSDIEFKIASYNRERVALMDQAASLAAQFSDNIYDSGQYTDMYNGETSGALPGFIGDYSNPFIDTPSQSDIPTGQYEAEMTALHAMDRELEMNAKRLEMFHEAKKTEIESVKEILKKNTEKDYKTFG